MRTVRLALLAAGHGAALFGLAVFASPLAAQSSSTGSIHGRVQDISTGDYLGNARVTIAGTNLTALTNEFGEYHISNVPAGEARVTIFYSGLPPQTATMNVAAGQRSGKDFELNTRAAQDQAIRLDAFTVTAAREMSEAAIATNEQRFAPNLKAVLAADTFGDPSEGNVAEFLKFMPSINVSYVDQDARSVSMRGLPNDTTIVTSDGNQLASATASANRTFEFELTSINNIARIEFNKTLLPDMAAEGIGGTINVVTKSAFQRSRPEFRYRAYANFNTTGMTLGKRHGPRDKANFLTRPGFDFSYIKPVSKTFGISISGALSSKYNPQYFAIPTWNRNADPATGVENPFLASFSNSSSPKITNRYSGRIGMDWRFAPRDVLRIGFSQNYYDAYWSGGNRAYNVGSNPASYSAAFTQGRPGAGSVSNGASGQYKQGTTWTPEFNYTHDGPVWKFELRGAYSNASYSLRNGDRGRFYSANLTMGSLNAAGAVVAPTVRFENKGDYSPTVIAVNAAGEPMDTRNLDNFFLNSAADDFARAADFKKTLALYGRRVVNLGVPVTIKAGGDIRESMRDSRAQRINYTFVGPDGRPATADNAASLYDLLSQHNVKRPLGMGSYQTFDPFKTWQLFVAHPEWWTRNPITELANLVANSRHVEETISSGYVRTDASFFRNRLAIMGGVRFQNYRVHAESGLVDNLAHYLHDEDGEVVLDPETGKPLLLAGNSLDIAGKTNVERGIITKNAVKGFHPSVSAVFRLTENLQLRGSFAKSINYPNLNHVAGGTTISDLTINQPRVTANSPLGPWTAHNYDIDLSYFTNTGGSFGLTFFRKDVSNFVNSVRHPRGTPEARAALEKYGYGQLAPLGFEVVEKYNGGEARLDGWEFEFRQNLDSYVPAWAHGVTVFFNTSYKAAPTGVGAANLSAQSQRLFNWGVVAKRGRLGANLRWNHVPEPKRRVPNTTHANSMTRLDIDLTYRVRRGVSLFANATNAMSIAGETYIYTENTPDYARRSSFRYYGVQCNVGIKGEF